MEKVLDQPQEVAARFLEEQRLEVDPQKTEVRRARAERAERSDLDGTCR